MAAERVQLLHVLARHDDADFEGAEAGGGQIVHGRPGGGKGAFAADGVVAGSGGTVDADLDVEVVERGELPGPLGGEPGPVRGELHADPSIDGVGHEVEEVRRNIGSPPPMLT